MNPDPLEDADGPNYYLYVKNNPLHYVDPDGRWALPVIWAAITGTVEFFTVTWGGTAALATAGATVGTATTVAAGTTTVVVSAVTVEAVAGAAVGIAAGVALYQGAGYLDTSLNKGDEENLSDKKAGPRTKPKNLEEQLALEEAKAKPEGAKEIMRGDIKDKRYPQEEWKKNQYIHRNPNGTKTTIHYWENRITGATEGFKFKNE